MGKLCLMPRLVSQWERFYMQYTTKLLKKYIKIHLKLIIVLIAFFSIGFFIPGFLSAVNLLNLVRQSSIVAICAVGVTMVIITRGIDLSSGGIISFCGMLNGMLMLSGLSIPISILITLAVGCLLGATNGFLISKLNVPPFIGTFVLGQIAVSLALVLRSGRSIGGFPAAYTFIGNGMILGVPLPNIIMLLFMTFGALLLAKSAFGNHVYAIGHSDATARDEGIAIKKVKVIVYAISGFCAASSGLLLSAQMDTAHPTQGEQFQLDAIAACIIGGVNISGGEGKVINSVIGAVLIGVIRNSLNLLGLHPFMQNVAVGSVIIVIVAISIFNKQVTLRKEKAY